MKFAVYIGGADNGFNTPVGGEGRYAFNLAQMLAYKGHTVDCYGFSNTRLSKPLWGSQKPIPNVQFLNSEAPEPCLYDAYFNCPWYEVGGELVCGDNVNAKVYVHNSFGWNANTERNESERCCGHHVVSHPYPGNQFVSDKHNLRLIPFPFYEQCAKINPTNRRKIVWTCKGVFDDDLPGGQPFHLPAVGLLSALRQASNKLGLECVFLTSKTFFSDRAQKMGVPGAISSIKNRTLIEGFLPKNELDAHLSETRMVPILPHYGASCFDATALGAVPIFYKETDIFAEFFPSAPKISISDTSEEVATLIERIFTDDEYYLILIEQVRKDIGLYSFESSYQHLMKVLEEFS